MGFEFRLSTHAQQRMQQRGITKVEVDWLCRFGGGILVKGGEMLWFNKKAMKRLKRYLGRTYAKFEKQVKGIYIVIVGSVIVTVGHRYKKIKT